MIGTTKRLLLTGIGTIALAILILTAGCSTGSWKASHGPTFNGTIQDVDLPSHVLTIAPLNAVSPAIVFQWSARSRFWANGLRVDPTFLQARDIVRIHYRTNSGEWTIQHLYLQTHRTVH